MRRREGLVALALGLSAAAFVPAATEAAGCAVVWGSLEKGAGEVDEVDPGPPLFDVRAGRHECYDRLVVDVRGQVTDFHVEYVAAVTGLASGDPVPLRGGRFLEVIVGADDRDAAGNLTYPRAGQSELVTVAGFSTFRQVAWADPRGRDRTRSGRARPVAVPGLHPGRPRNRLAVGDRRRPPLVTSGPEAGSRRCSLPSWRFPVPKPPVRLDSFRVLFYKKDVSALSGRSS